MSRAACDTVAEVVMAHLSTCEVGTTGSSASHSVPLPNEFIQCEPSNNIEHRYAALATLSRSRWPGALLFEESL